MRSLSFFEHAARLTGALPMQNASLWGMYLHGKEHDFGD